MGANPVLMVSTVSALGNAFNSVYYYVSNDSVKNRVQSYNFFFGNKHFIKKK